MFQLLQFKNDIIFSLKCCIPTVLELGLYKSLKKCVG